jgi:hypothetical protein
MCRAVKRPALFVLVAAAFMVLTGCRPRVSNHRIPLYDIEKSGQRAIAQLDSNGDGAIAGPELDKCPGLKAALDRVDPSGKGRITAEMIAARLDAWHESRLGRMRLNCTVTHNGKPLEGALVKFVPEKFLKHSFEYSDDPKWTAAGKTDKDGRAMISVPVSGIPEDPPGVPPGFYRVEITKPGEDIPTKYNTETTLGQEVARDAKGIEEGIEERPNFNLEY